MSFFSKLKSNYSDIDKLKELEQKRNDSGRFNRFGAYFLDHYVQLIISSVAVLIIFFMAYQNIGSDEISPSIATLPENWQMPTVLLVMALMASYNILLPFFMHGQTLGKKAIGIKIVKANGDDAGFVNYLLRYMAHFFLEANTFTSAIGGVYFYVLQQFVPFAERWNGITFLIFVLSGILAGFQKERRSLHDFIAGTKVIYIGRPEKASEIENTNQTVSE